MGLWLLVLVYGCLWLKIMHDIYWGKRCCVPLQDPAQVTPGVRASSTAALWIAARQ